MRLPDLDALLARHGRARPPETGWNPRVQLDPPALVVPGDRGTTDVSPFESEDALCRHLLVQVLLADPLPGGDAPRPPVVLEGGEPERADGAPSLAWRRELDARTLVAARVDGHLALLDASALRAHGPDGTIHLVVLDVATGHERWARPLLPMPKAPAVAIAGGLLLLGIGTRTSAFDVLTGAERWSVASPLPLALPRSCRHAPHLTDDPPWRMLATDGAVAVLVPAGQAAPAVGVDLATGETRWSAVEGVSDTRSATNGPVVADHLVHAVGTDGRIVVDAVAVADGARTRLGAADTARGWLAAGWPGDPVPNDRSNLLVLSAPGDAATIVRCSQRAPGGVGTALGDVVIAGGRGVFASPPPDGRRRLAARAGGSHFVTGGDWRGELCGPDGRKVLGLRGSPSELIAVGERGWLASGAAGTELLSPAGVGGRRAGWRWTAPGRLVALPMARNRRSGAGSAPPAPDVAWVTTPDGLTGVDLDTGEAVWRIDEPGRDFGLMPLGTQGYRDDDGHAVVARGEALLAWRA